MNTRPEQAIIDEQRLERLREIDLPRDDIAFRLLCAFNGIEPDQAPEHFWWFHNPHMRDAWQRVADKAREIFNDTDDA